MNHLLIQILTLCLRRQRLYLTLVLRPRMYVALVSETGMHTMHCPSRTSVTLGIAAVLLAMVVAPTVREAMRPTTRITETQLHWNRLEKQLETYGVTLRRTVTEETR